MRRFLRGGVIASAFFFFWWGAVLLAWLVVPILYLARRDPRERRRLCQRLVRQSFRLFHEYMRVCDLLGVTFVEGSVPRPAGPVVLVANHPTLVDVTALFSVYDDIDVCCVVKSSLIHNPFVGPILRACGHIDAGAGEGLAGGAVMDEALKRLAEGCSVLIFPEGTRSFPGQMRPFRRGAFELACRAGVPIVPIFMTCTPPALSKGLPFWAQPDHLADLRIQRCPALDVLAPGVTSRRLKATVEADFRLQLDTQSIGIEDEPSPPTP